MSFTARSAVLNSARLARYGRMVLPSLAVMACAIAAVGIAHAADAPPPLPVNNDPHLLSAAMAEPAPDPVPEGSSGYPVSTGTVTTAPDARRWAIFGQMTLTTMSTLGFHQPYAGDHSLPAHDLRETFDATLFLGARVWQGGEIWVNGEVDQGFGVGNTLGMAGYASGEAYKLGSASPYTRLQRAFVRQTFDLGGAHSDVDAQANQMAGTQAANRLVLTVGKFSPVDIFDSNTYAHDPRGDFLNWSIIDAGAFDYAGDPWGYSYGAAAELTLASWTGRLGVFNMSDVPGGMKPTTNFSELEVAGELEHRHTLLGHAGTVRAGVWLIHGRLGRYDDAIAWGLANGAAPDTNQVLTMHTRLGGYINAEQGLTDTLGVFLRASDADGAYGAYDFTDIDRSLSLGLSLGGKGWHRAGDTVGLALVANQISKAGQAYFAAGGMGLLIGDGQLPHPGTEKIAEVYYAWRPWKPVAVTFDEQLVFNPAYNKDRGPVDIVGVRLHVAF